MISPVNPTSPRQAWADWLLVALFAGMLWLPNVDFFTGIDVTRPPDENRLPAPKPQFTQWSFAGVQNYMTGAEVYFNDHFGCRKRLIRWFQQWKSRVFHDETGHKVLHGQHGWLFTGELQMIEHYLGLAKFTPAQMKGWQMLLEKRRDWLAARGIKYLFIIAPDKHSIYPEELPAWLQAAAPAGRETKLDQFLQYMKDHSTVEILDLRPAVLAAKKIAPVYLQNDSHWNLYGSFVAGQQVVKTLSKDFPGLPPLRLDDFIWTNKPTVGGDLCVLLGVSLPEKNNFVFTPKPAIIAPVGRLATNIISMWDPHKKSVIVENPRPLTVTAVIFHDSFGVPWQEFLGFSFKRMVFMSEHREFNTRVITENHPQVVVNEMLERFFNTFDPAEIMAKDALP